MATLYKGDNDEIIIISLFCRSRIADYMDDI